MPATPLIAALAFACASPVAVDGDTLRCRGLGLVRLLGIDAPELPGHCRTGRQCVAGDGWASKAQLAALVRARPVNCTPAGRDAYGRVLASCRTAAAELSCAMVASGHAIERYSRLHCP